LKRQVKSLATAIASRRSRECADGRVVVLCYHSIHPTKSFASATPEQFARQLEWIGEHCEVIPFSCVADASKAPRAGRPRVALTFDDGYADNYEFALAQLQKYRLTATFFLTTGLISKDPVILEKFQRERRCSYDEIRPLEWSQVDEMAAAGMEIGAHTHSHPNLLSCGVDKARSELTVSKAILEDRLGTRVESFAFPYGKRNRAFDVTTMRLCAEAGYLYAASVLFRNVRAADPVLAIPRMFVARDEVPGLRAKIYGAWDVIGAWQEYAPKWIARTLSPQDFPKQ
jgi:peptidoglycan/xylan/chitin deacetylase (PgdA/CDA1 family)